MVLICFTCVLCALHERTMVKKTAPKRTEMVKKSALKTDTTKERSSSGTTKLMSESTDKMQTKVEAIESEAGSCHPEACVLCRDPACVRIRLRQCDHHVCVSCLLGYLQGQIALKAKVGIRCPSGFCPQEIHENDIRAVLDKNEPGLDVFMPPVRRQWLQYCHDKDSIVLALADRDPRRQDELTRRCPLCKNIYYKRRGCNNVVCPNLRCQTRFCFTCGDPIRGIGHFADGKCRVGFEDIERGSVIIYLLLKMNLLAYLLLWPVIIPLFYIGMPICIFLAFPYYAVRSCIRSASQFTDRLTIYEWIALTPKMIIQAALASLLGLPAAACSIFTGSCLICLYNLLILLKCTPLFNLLLNHYDRLLPFAGLLGLGHIRSMLKEAREEKKREKKRRAAELEREQMAEAEVVLDEITPAEQFP